MKISIIVPCYNVEKYISKCIDSLLNQTLKDIEIIIIDDGSTDNTRDIIKKYQMKDKRIVPIYKKNGGVSAARNDGLDLAQGEYIAFLDSDDYIEKNMLFDMYNKAKENDYDLVACDVNVVYPTKMEYLSSNIDDNDCARNLMIDSYAVIWNKIYKKEVLNDIRFNIEMNYCEDVLFLYMVYARINKIGSIKKNYYNYIQRAGSLTSKFGEKLFLIPKLVDSIVNHYKSINKFNDYCKELEYTYVRYLYGTFLKRVAIEQDYKKYIEEFNKCNKMITTNFRKYRRNKYFYKSFKGLCLVLFNKFFAIIMYNYFNLKKR